MTRRGVGPCDRVLHHVSVTAEELHTTVHHRDRLIRGDQLGHGCRCRVVVPVDVVLNAVVHRGLDGQHLGLELGQLEFGVLEFDERLAECLAFLGVLDGLDQGALGHAGADGGDDQPLAGQLFHELVEAQAVLVAEAVCDRHTHVGEEQLPRVLTVLTHLLQHPTALESGEILGFGDDE